MRSFRLPQVRCGVFHCCWTEEARLTLMAALLESGVGICMRTGPQIFPPREVCFRKDREHCMGGMEEAPVRGPSGAFGTQAVLEEGTLKLQER